MMTRSRLEAFSDGVIAIVLTIMMLDLKVPVGTDLSELWNVLPAFLGYVLSFVHIGIYWNNHHHLFQAVRSVNGVVLLANLHLLFWLSLVPFGTSWMSRTGFAAGPVFTYGMILLCSAIAYFILSQALIRHHGDDSQLAKAYDTDFKGKLSLGIYGVALVCGLLHPWLSCAGYALVAAMWIVPDRRIESSIGKTQT